MQPCLPLAEYIALENLPSVAVSALWALPRASGIYFVVSDDGIVQYIGRTRDLYARWHPHHRSIQYRKYPHYRIAWVTVSNPELLPAIEQACIDFFHPKDNGQALAPDEQILQCTMKTTPEAQRLLRLIAAHTGEKQYAVLERLLRQELRQLQKETQE
jgi:excinuclease UvrABC nuclease subunit